MKVKPIILKPQLVASLLSRSDSECVLLWKPFRRTTIEKGDILWVRERHKIRLCGERCVQVQYWARGLFFSKGWRKNFAHFPRPPGFSPRQERWRSPSLLPRWAARLWFAVDSIETIRASLPAEPVILVYYVHRTEPRPL